MSGISIVGHENIGQKRKVLSVYEEKGYVILDDFLPKGIAEGLIGLWDKTSWEEIDQSRDHYKHVFSTPSANLPKSDELYMAKFGRSRQLENSGEIQSVFRAHFVSVLNEFSREQLSSFDIRCYRQKPGQYYRTHIDDYAGAVGVIYYINPRWCWDWGGILHICLDGEPEQVDLVYPKFNRLIILNHEKFRFPHFISTVSEYALIPRYTIVAFCK